MSMNIRTTKLLYCEAINMLKYGELMHTKK